MPDLSDLKPLNVHCKGGLILDRSPQEIPPGAAIRLENLEPDLNGGYRRMGIMCNMALGLHGLILLPTAPVLANISSINTIGLAPRFL